MTRLRIALVTMAGLILSAHPGPAQQPDSLDRDYGNELPRIAPLSPGEALKSFDIHPDFRIQLAASEPLVRDPVAMAFDEDGRLFVVEMRGYSELRDADMGTIRRLEDTDGDGLFDSGTTYVDKLEWPTAVACWNGGVFVGDAPNIYYCKDTDGDGVADTREIVFTGFGLDNVQGLLNTFLWGLDNRIHGATSASGGVISLAGSNTPAVELNGRDFSFDPRDLTMRAESGGAQHGMSFDRQGRKFVCSNSDHIQLVRYEDRYIARNPFSAPPGARTSIAADGAAADVFRISPLEPWRIVRTRLRVQGLVPGPVEGGGTAAGYFTSATGVTCYLGDAWPEAYRGSVFIGDVGSNLVHRKVMEPDGLSLLARRADENTEFLRSRDIWFRPVQFANGPDGALYLADMYREVIEHPDSLPPIIKQHLDLNSGNELGRIYRIVPKDYKPRPIPKLSGYSPAKLAELLAHPNAWHRQSAARLLFERQDKSASQSIRGQSTGSTLPEGRIQALYTLDGIGSISVDDVLRGLRDSDPWVRVHALRVSEDHCAGQPELQAAMAECAKDSDLQVRYQAAFSVGALDPALRAQSLAEIAASTPGDNLVNAAIMSSISGVAADVYLALAKDEAYRKSGEGGSFLAHLARQAGASSPKPAISSVLEILAGFAGNDKSLVQASVRGLIEGTQLTSGREEIRELLRANPVSAEALDAMLVAARGRASDNSQSANARVEAVRRLSLDTYANATEPLRAILSANEPVELRAAAIQALRAYDAEDAGSMLIDAWPTLGPALRGPAMEALFSRTPWLGKLLAAIAEERFPAANLDSTRRNLLLNHPDESIRAQAAGIPALKGLGSRDEVVQRYQSALAMTGDPERGKAVFTENCAACHRIRGQGHALGPDLVTVVQAGADKILVNVLDPNREVNPSYTNYAVETTDGEMFTGVITAESANSVTLGRANGETDTLLRETIASIRATNLSIMPEGWEEGISPEGMADLIAYLSAIE